MCELHNRDRQTSSGFMVFILLVLVAGCGPGPSDEGSHSGASVGASGGLVTSSEPVVSEASPVTGPTPIPSDRDTSGTRSEPLVVPAWIAKELASPDVQVRLQALDRLVQQGQTGSVDPLMLALTDPDERVQARALELIVQDWQWAQAAKPAAGQGIAANGERR